MNRPTKCPTKFKAIDEVRRKTALLEQTERQQRDLDRLQAQQDAERNEI
jgi:hypothetical protein